jgi:hypothetical protein
MLLAKRWVTMTEIKRDLREGWEMVKVTQVGDVYTVTNLTVNNGKINGGC